MIGEPAATMSTKRLTAFDSPFMLFDVYSAFGPAKQLQAALSAQGMGFQEDLDRKFHTVCGSNGENLA